MNSDSTSYREAVSDSAALLELSKILNGSQDLDFILGNVMLSSMGKLVLTKACVFLRNDAGKLYPRTWKGIRYEGGVPEFELPQLGDSFVELNVSPGETGPAPESFEAFCLSLHLTSIVPMILDGSIVGVLCFGSRFNGKSFNEREITLLESIAAIAATAVKNAMLIEALRAANRKLDERIQEQQTLYEISREMNSSFEERSILRLLGYALMGQMKILRYAVITRAGNSFEIAAIKLPGYEHNETAIGALFATEDPAILTNGARLAGYVLEWTGKMGIELVIPMVSQNETRGILCLGHRMGIEGYQPPEVEFLIALANRTIVALENAHMLREMFEKQRLDEQLQVARIIQQDLLPSALPEIAGYELCAENTPSQQVGGDYYDGVPLDPDRTLIAIADVSGKGIPASLLMANVQAGLRTLSPLDITLSEATTRLNKLIYDNTSADKFITFFWGILDRRTHVFTYVNAGHNPPILVHRGGAYEELGEGGIILGALPSTPPYDTGSVTLLEEDLLVLYTDGFSEAMSYENEEFSEERVRKILTRTAYPSARKCLTTIREELMSFTHGAAQSDDITIIVLRRQ